MNDRRITTAIHEGAHAVAAALLGLTVESVSIRPGKTFCGVTLVSGGEEIEDLATERQQRHLVAVEQQDYIVSDDEAAREAERQIAGDEAAGRLVAWLGWETRRLVGSELFRELTLPIAEQLLAHCVLGGQVVHDAIAAKTPSTSDGTRAAARLKNHDGHHGDQA